MRFYLSSPNTQQQAEHLGGKNVLLSAAIHMGCRWIYEYQPTFGRVLIDSGAFSAHNSGKEIDVGGYRAWSGAWRPHADAVAGLDDIGGDWRQSLKNYEAIPWGFPTMHDTDPDELLPDLVEMARERGGWIGLGAKPPRQGKENWVRWACDNIPDDLHVHGWALGGLYSGVRRLDSADSTAWLRGAMRIRTHPELQHLTYGECIDIAVKRIVRRPRLIEQDTPLLFGAV